MNISIIGGDLRIIRLAQMYAKENKLYTYGIEKYFEENNLETNIKICKSLEECIENATIVISSIPLTKDNRFLNAPFAKENIEIKNILKKLHNKKIVAGNIPKEFYVEGVEPVDLLKSEKLSILNSIPTVEGTIKIVINEREETIHESNILICGFGRIGKIMCDRFKSLGANIYCTARKEEDLTWIREHGYIPLIYSEIKKYAHKIDIVINTVPSIVLDEKEIDNFNKNVLMIDVASNPGGINKEYAKRKGIKIITALQIPGKEMPTTAAKYIKELINEKVIKI